MPAIIQQPSDQLIKLKLFLEKSKTEFIADNPDLASWISDRNFTVHSISALPEETDSSTVTSTVDSELLAKLDTSKDKNAGLASSISQEEYNSIMEKIVQLLQLPPGQLEEDSELYLEQQLSDILGFDLVATLDNHKLLYSTGIMQAEPHLKRSPTDTLSKHDNLHEAGMNSNRSKFGWFATSQELSKEIIESEKYHVSIPLYFYPDWAEKSKELKSWYKFRKIVIINPAEQIAVVGVIGNIGPNILGRKQFGGSPELIQAGKIWSPHSAGKVLAMFVDDPENTVPLGPINFNQLFKGKK
jgi:hypothetical protein